MVPFTPLFHYLFFSSLLCVECRLAMWIVQICATSVMNLTLTRFPDHESEKLRENTEMAELIDDCSGALPATCFK